jgi:aspartyl/glutamyl-tRNA(Asn/Gln) amidotransferase C subunit
MNRDEVIRLAELSRIQLSEEEIGRFPDELEAILAYVGQVNEMVSVAEVRKEVGVVHNVFREDVVTNEPESFTADIMKEMPATEGRFLQVKKILNND